MAKEKKVEKVEDNTFDLLDGLIQQHFEEVVDLSKIDGKVKNWYDVGVYALNYSMSKNLRYGIPAGRITSFDGLSSTGKSLMAASAMRDPQLDMIILIETEGGGNAKELIEFAGVDERKVRILKANTFSNYKISKKNGKIEEVNEDKFPVKKETPDFVYKEGATRLVKKFVYALDFTPKLRESKVLIILDSLGNLQSVREMSGTADMGKRAQEIGNFFRTFDVAFEKSNLAFIFTNKLYTNIGNIYDPWKATGGLNVEFNPSMSVRFSTSAVTDDKSEKELTAEKERRKTSLGSSLKTVRATIQKSRFGTEMRNAWFLLDFSVGPVKLSGLFTLLKDFGVITGATRYSIKGWNGDNSFYKKDFINLVLQDEENSINYFQSLLELREIEIKDERRKVQINDLSEMKDEEGNLIQQDVDEEDDGQMETVYSEMMRAMENEPE